MQKNGKDIKLLNTDSSLKKNVLSNGIKTTNVNILLNRVRIKKKNDFKKKIFLSSLMFVIVSFFIFIVISI